MKPEELLEETSPNSLYTAYYYVSSDYDRDIPEICDGSPIREFSRIFQPCVQGLVFLIGISGNILVLLTYGLVKSIKSMTDIYLINLALADLLLLLTLPFWSISAVIGWVFGDEICKMVQGVHAINFFSGILFLACISVDRYFEIVQAVKALTLRQRTLYYSKVITPILWMVSVIFSLPEFIYSESKQLDESYSCTMVFPEDITSTVKSLSNFSQIILGFIVPFVVMVVCYSIIIRSVLSSRGFRKYKALKVIISVVVVFLVFQLPYTLVTFMEITDFLESRQMSCDEVDRKNIAIIITSNLSFTRCCLNPIIYVFVGVNFRKDIFLLLKNFGCISRATFASYYGSYRDSRTSVMMTETSSFTL